VSGVALLSRARACERHDRTERAKPGDRDVRHESRRRRRRRGGAKRELERARDPPVQGRGHIPEGAVPARDPARAHSPDVHRAGRLRDSRAGAERVRAGQSARSSSDVLPHRPGIRGAPAMIANAAFLAALTTFVLVAWLADELSFLAPYKATIFRAYGVHILAGGVLIFIKLAGAVYYVARWLFLRDAGRKLTHIDHQLRTAPGLHDELRRYFQTKSR